MSYNIQSGAGSLERTAGVIRGEHPDLVALQEVDVHWAERSQFADQARELAARLDMDVRFAPIYHIASPEPDRPAREFGVALLSRLSVVSWRNDTLTRLSTQDANPTPAPMPGFLEATIDVCGRAVKVFTTHLDYRADPSVRRSQVGDMLRYIDSSVPTILAGDLNATPDAAELALLLRVLRDAWPSTAGAGLTYPADNPVKRIDYVLASSHFRVRSASVPATQASDHRPVVVDLLLDPR
jgi:endonuclease/exonuclease/phosphatase family metal-dependent hydrolase